MVDQSRSKNCLPIHCQYKGIKSLAAAKENWVILPYMLKDETNSPLTCLIYIYITHWSIYIDIRTDRSSRLYTLHIGYDLSSYKKDSIQLQTLQNYSHKANYVLKVSLRRKITMVAFSNKIKPFLIEYDHVCYTGREKKGINKSG